MMVSVHPIGMEILMSLATTQVSKEVRCLISRAMEVFKRMLAATRVHFKAKEISLPNIKEDSVSNNLFQQEKDSHLEIPNRISEMFYSLHLATIMQ